MIGFRRGTTHRALHLLEITYNDTLDRKVYCLTKETKRKTSREWVVSCEADGVARKKNYQTAVPKKEKKRASGRINI